MDDNIQNMASDIASQLLELDGIEKELDSVADNAIQKLGDALMEYLVALDSD